MHICKTSDLASCRHGVCVYKFCSLACVIYNRFRKSVFVITIILHLTYRVCQKFSLPSNLR